MEIYDILNDKGIIANVSDKESVRKLLKEKTTLYLGIDPTFKSLHVGHLFQVITASQIALSGSKVIFVLGTGTTRIGDPTGKSETRKMISEDEIESNKVCIEKQIRNVLNNLSIKNENVIFVDNNSWLSKLNYMEFLKEIGIHFSVNRMLSFETFKNRIDSKNGLNFIELNYQLLQSYDFYHLNLKHDCKIQMGGDDQWANMVAGIELTRKKSGREVYCLTIPLICTADGKKMGKTEKGSLFLDKELCAPYEFFQYWRNVKDEDVYKFFLYFTPKCKSEIEKMKEEVNINKAKEELAYYITSIVHSKQDADAALQASISLFSGDKDDAFGPKFIIKTSEIESGILVADLFANAKLCKSKSESRRLIAQGGAYFEEQKINSEECIIKAELTKEEITWEEKNNAQKINYTERELKETSNDAHMQSKNASSHENEIIVIRSKSFRIRAGKKKYCIVEIVDD